MQSRGAPTNAIADSTESTQTSMTSTTISTAFTQRLGRLQAGIYSSRPPDLLLVRSRGNCDKAPSAKGKYFPRLPRAPSGLGWFAGERFSVTPSPRKLEFSLDEERTGKDLGCWLGRRRFPPRKATKRKRASCHASHRDHLQIEYRRVGSQRDQAQAGCLFPLVDRQRCGKQRVRIPLLSSSESSLQPASRRRGRLLSVEFMRLPSKRQYADYYQQIQNPIALDEIKSRIETGKYPSLDAVRQDLELCFKNAKKYNMRDSPIWKDAKHLHVCFRLQSVVFATQLTSSRNSSTRNTPG